MQNESLHKLISVIIITFGREKELKECLQSVLSQNFKDFEVILVDNSEDEKISEYVVENINKINDERIHYFKTAKNLGVAGGRNFGIKKARGDILVFIDDDAFFEEENVFQKIYEEFSENLRLGVLSFKIINYFSKKIERREFPHRDKKLDPDKKFETTYFLGGGCSIRKEIFDKVGLYSEDFFYGMEELDLSFKILNAGYDIFYFPQVVVFHKKSPEGRLRDKEMWQKILENRIKVSVRNLPWIYVIVSSIIWIGKIIWETKGDIRIVLRVFKNILDNKEKLKKERLVIDAKVVKKIKKLQGRLFY